LIISESPNNGTTVDTKETQKQKERHQTPSHKTEIILFSKEKRFLHHTPVMLTAVKSRKVIYN